MRRAPLPPWTVGVLGSAALLALWWAGAATFLRGIGSPGGGAPGAIPTPWQVLSQMGEDGFGFYWRNASVTLAEAGAGYAWGNALALALAFAVLLVPQAERLAVQLAVVTYCLPVVAIGPVIFIVLGPPRTGDPSGTAVALAALSVFFTTMVSALAGLKAADKACLDVVTVFGGRRIHQLLKVRLIAAVPSVFAALKIAAPAALLGAVLGEYVGGVDRGLGPAMVNAQQTLEVARVWGVALACAVLAGGTYALLGLASRIAAPWASGVRTGGL
ncbi:ABC transporter permease [Arthrobacter caoxuetaonis]|uniref:ABC transporter permease subunit n=1 Tax=Arthrobacter caoxuetaonis TaxID=2886935 RepID=A0A9X1MAH2_9MICC|nr:ABC transporter permease subunit [Arthrobacter caoxuetaonis]MCC3296463.1 ABC transporter permease subunit [Arthrobacter caoxuetaonis]USQ56703.1 ABC transporter permease subunit [Arthrobacter caoxuetaonis]